jgi:hypothetical protein
VENGLREGDLMDQETQVITALISAEQQLLNAAGAARVAARRIDEQRELAPLREEILEAARTLEKVGHDLRARRRSVLAARPSADSA